MTQISILGASGKVGQELRTLVESTPELALVDAIGRGTQGDTIPLSAVNFEQADVLIDFSTPAATMELLEHVRDNALPLVIGTTGFTSEQVVRLNAEAARRPVLIGANFTKGFESFASSASMLAQALPNAAITVGEVYKAAKKPAPSGTTQRLAAELSAATGHDVDLDIQRIGDTAGINTVVFNYKVATMRIELTVNTRAAYAAGALEAALWLIGQPDGLYSPKDMLNH